MPRIDACSPEYSPLTPTLLTAWKDAQQIGGMVGRLCEVKLLT